MIRAWHPAAVAAFFSVVAGSASGARADDGADSLAAQLRSQGFACAQAQKAERVPQASRPDEAVWIVTCSNASYRMRLIPDMAAKVETLP